MPDVAYVNLIHWCVVWKRLNTSTRYGQAKLDQPVEMRCRWTYELDDLASPAQDRTVESRGRSIPIGEEVPLGSYVWGPGLIEDMPDDPEYYEVIGTRMAYDLKGKNPHHRITLQKASKTLLQVQGA